MIKINAKTDYGLLLMTEMALKRGQFVPVSPIAKKLCVSVVFLSQIASSLLKAGLIISKEGVGGGYGLARSAGSISLLEIVEAINGPIVARCFSLKKEKCPNGENCYLRKHWAGVLDELKIVLKKKKLISLTK